MCYLKFHECKYCSNEYQCYVANNVCPTINADRNAYMCPDCEKKLEEIIDKYKIDIAMKTLEEIMELE